jgi:hypothetical protein
MMKNPQSIVVLWLSLVLCACSAASEDGHDPVVEVNHESPVGVSWEEYRAAAKMPGAAGYYVVEWDLVFTSEAALREHFDQISVPETPKLAMFRQLSTGFEPEYAGLEALDINYCISNSFTNKSTVISDIAAATAGWEEVANVIFRYDSAQDANCNQNNTIVDFAVVPQTVTGLAGCGANKMLWGLTCPIGNGSTSAEGILSVNYGVFSAFPGLTGAGLFRHELGHILGFRHEHPWAPSGGGCDEPQTSAGVDITGRRLTNYDQASVMHYPQCAGIAGDFIISTLDGEGARQIYEMPAAWYVPVTNSPP